MRAVWNQVIHELSGKMLIAGITLPDVWVADDNWHKCEGAAYRLNSQLPFFAFFAANGGLPVVWRHDAQRLLTMHQEALIAAALAECPIMGAHPHTTAPRASLETEPAIEQPPRQQARTRAETGSPALKDGSARLGAAPPAALPQHSALSNALVWLRNTLADGAVATTVQIRTQAGNDGLSWASVRRAAASLGIVVAREGFGPGGRWTWRLP